MSNERVTAISFMINGRQAEQTLERLTRRAEELRAAIDEAQESGNAQNVARLNKELEGVNREIAIINRNVRSVENVRRRGQDTLSKQNICWYADTLWNVVVTLQSIIVAYDRVPAKADKRSVYFAFAQSASMLQSKRINIFNTLHCYIS